MRENRTYGSEGGEAQLNEPSLPPIRPASQLLAIDEDADSHVYFGRAVRATRRSQFANCECRSCVIAIAQTACLLANASCAILMQLLPAAQAIHVKIG